MEIEKEKAPVVAGASRKERCARLSEALSGLSYSEWCKIKQVVDLQFSSKTMKLRLDTEMDIEGLLQRKGY